MNGRTVVLFSFLGISLLSACGSDSGKNENRPIVLGDSSTIVTETDPRYLSDFVPDVQLQTVKTEDTAAGLTDTGSRQEEPTAQPRQEKPQVPETHVSQVPQATGQGLDIPFKEVHIFIPNIETRAYRNQNPEKANGVTYELSSGSLSGTQLRILQGNVLKVSQRYQTIVIAKNEFGELQLESLNHTTDWKPLRGNNNVYNIAIDTRRLETEPATAANIRNSVNTAARKKRLSRELTRKWENSVSHVRSVNDKPLNIILRSVIWKVEGKNDKGRPFQKQIRIDLPL